jgi:hypothetical protein
MIDGIVDAIVPEVVTPSERGAVSLGKQDRVAFGSRRTAEG